MTDKAHATPEMNDILVRSGSARREEALAAQHELAVALQTPLRQGVLNGDITVSYTHLTLPTTPYV